MSLNQSAPSTQTGPSPSSAWSAQMLRGAAISAPAGVDEIFVPGDELRIVGGQEENHRSDNHRKKPPGKALGVDDLRLALRRVPFELARRADVAGYDAGHPDAVRPEFARHR